MDKYQGTVFLGGSMNGVRTLLPAGTTAFRDGTDMYKISPSNLDSEGNVKAGLTNVYLLLNNFA